MTLFLAERGTPDIELGNHTRFKFYLYCVLLYATSQTLVILHLFIYLFILMCVSETIYISDAVCCFVISIYSCKYWGKAVPGDGRRSGEFFQLVERLWSQSGYLHVVPCGQRRLRATAKRLYSVIYFGGGLAGGRDSR